MTYKIIAVILICLLILTSGCAGLERQSDSGSQLKESQYRATESSGYAAPDSPSLKPAMAPQPTQGVQGSSLSKAESAKDKGPSGESEQKIIKTGTIRLEVADVPSSAAQITTFTEELGGQVQSSSVYAGQSDEYTGSLTIRIPADKFDQALSGVSALGKVTSTSISAEDVTEEYVDLSAQNSALEGQLAQYNRIMLQAVNVSEILTVQREIERVQVELDRINGRMKYLNNRVSFSTISISLSEPAQVVTSTGYTVASVISDGISGFIETFVILVVFFLSVLPLLLIGLAGVLIYRRWKSSHSE
ncbi:MAG TPA: DUF4349 domain-containing protein [Methanospirillum sp.]|nr:DUF4349 domain-containing protein [Methanospirillum sp.]